MEEMQAVFLGGSNGGDVWAEPTGMTPRAIRPAAPRQRNGGVAPLMICFIMIVLPSTGPCWLGGPMSASQGRYVSESGVTALSGILY